MNIKEAQDSLYNELKQNDNIIGAYNNEREIFIWLLNETAFNLVPSEYEGYNVIAEVTGEVFLQKN